MSRRASSVDESCRRFLAAALLAAPALAGELHPDLSRVIKETPPEMPIGAIVFLADQVDLDVLTSELERFRATRPERHLIVVETLMERAAASQRGLLAHLDGLRAGASVAEVRPLWITNAVAVTATGAALEEIASRSDVGTVYFDYPTRSDSVEPGEGPDIGSASPRDVILEQRVGGRRGVEEGIVYTWEPNLVAINADTVWLLGYRGQGMLVSALDTGVDGTHEALAANWRGNDPAYAGHPEWAWYQSSVHDHGTVPQDYGAGAASSHGTHTMGILCGNRPLGFNQIGVAPEAEWISAAVVETVHQLSDRMAALQWSADPDGNPATDFDVPCVSNNSWGEPLAPICDPTLWGFIDSVEAAGVAVVWAVGNGLIGRPQTRAADELNSFTVGGFNHLQSGFPVPTSSGGGLVFCTPDGTGAVKPEVSAPGVQVISSIEGGGYAAKGGTSMAAPHVAGVLTLMFQANPNLTVAQAKRILIDTAVDNGDCGNDTRYGWGMIDALAAVQAALAFGTPGVVVVPTDQPTIQQAVDAAADGDEIRLLDGTYTGAGNRRITVTKSVTIRSANGPANCIVDCQNQDLGFSISGAGVEVVLEGLTIRNGLASTASGALADSGGGVRVTACAGAVVRGCTIESCSATLDGGGIVFDDGDSLSVENCNLQGNSLPVAGSNGKGGGIFVSCGSGTSEVRVVDTLIVDNASQREGGGVAVVHAGGDPTRSTVTLRNCTIANNQVTGGISSVLGGGVFLQEGSGGNASWRLRNTILWGNLVDDTPASTFGDQLAFGGLGSTVVSYCDVQGGSASVSNLNTGQWGTGNISQNPSFVNATTNFHLTKFSVCINKGDPGYPYTGGTDIDGGVRVLEDRVEIGADERFYGAQQP